MDLNVRRMAAGLEVMAAGSIVAPACADNESSLFVRLVQAPDEMCQYPTPGSDVQFFPRGTMDVRVTSIYTAALIVGNQVVPRGDAEQIRTETSRIQLYAADVNILDAGESTVLRADGSESAFEVPISGLGCSPS